MAGFEAKIPIEGLTLWVRNIADALKFGTDAAMLETTEFAYREAVLNAKDKFNHTPGRVRTGQLMNAIYRRYDPSTKTGTVGIRLAYGAIQEFGGSIRPVSAKHLWVKNWLGAAAQFKRLTPREFMAKKEADPRHFALFRNPKTGNLIAAYNAKGGSPAQTIALFTLVDQVKLPERPYIRPAVEKAAALFGEVLRKRMESDLR